MIREVRLLEKRVKPLSVPKKERERGRMKEKKRERKNNRISITENLTYTQGSGR